MMSYKAEREYPKLLKRFVWLNHAKRKIGLSFYSPYENISKLFFMKRQSESIEPKSI